jgi:hypothetical protein
MNVIENDFYKMWIEDGILYCLYLAEHWDAAMVDAGIKDRLALADGKVFPMFSDIRKLKSITREGRQSMAKKDAGKGISVVAILQNSKVQRVIYNFFNAIYKAPAPAKMFNNKEDALKWLEKYKCKIINHG